MNRYSLFAVVLLSATSILVGCNRPEAKLQGQIEALRRSVLANQKSADDDELVGPIKYDIRKTDSLVSPLEGEIDYTVTYKTMYGQTWRERRLTFAYQRGAWVLVRVQNKPLHMLYERGWEDARLSKAEWDIFGTK